MPYPRLTLVLLAALTVSVLGVPPALAKGAAKRPKKTYYFFGANTATYKRTNGSTYTTHDTWVLRSGDTAGEAMKKAKRDLEPRKAASRNRGASHIGLYRWEYRHAFGETHYYRVIRTELEGRVRYTCGYGTTAEAALDNALLKMETANWLWSKKKHGYTTVAHGKLDRDTSEN